MAQLKSKIKASTLLEVIIAMVIILIVFTLAMGISTHLLSGSASFKQEQAKAITHQLIDQSINESKFEDEDFQQGSLRFTKTVSPYAGYPDLVQITITAYQQGKQISQSRAIIKKIQTHEK